MKAGPSERAVVDFQRLRTVHRQAGLLNTKTTCGACAACDRKWGRREQRGSSTQRCDGLLTISDRPAGGKPSRTGERTAFQERHRRKFPDRACRVHTDHRTGFSLADRDETARHRHRDRVSPLIRTDTPRREQDRHGKRTLSLRSTKRSPSCTPLGKRELLRSKLKKESETPSCDNIPPVSVYAGERIQAIPITASTSVGRDFR